MTLRERYTTGLLAAGFALVKSTPRYEVFEHSHYSTAGRVYVGTKGSIRVGRTVGESIPMSTARRQVLLARTEQPTDEQMQQLHETDR